MPNQNSLVDHPVANVSQFGELVSLHLRRNLSKSRFLLKLGRFMMFATPISLVLGIVWLVAGLTAPGIMLLVFGGLTMLPTVFFTLLYTLSETLPCLAIYEKGLAFHSNKEHKEFTWTDATRIYIYSWKFTNSQSTTTTYRIAHRSGEVFTIDDRLENFEKAAAKIKEQIHSFMGPWQRELESQGKPVIFDDIIVEARGISIEGKLYLWTSIASSELRNGFWVLMLKPASDGNRVAKEIRCIPNLDLLLPLVDRMIVRNRADKVAG
jgi:hypothetical protein